MPVTVIAEDVEIRGGENIVEVNEYDYPLVMEEGGRYIGIDEDGSYDIFEKGVVKKIRNPTSCVATPVSNNGQHSGSVEIDVDELRKPIRGVVKTLMSEYTLIHGNRQEID